MSDVATFTVAPPMRCCQPIGHPVVAFCGELAGWMRPGQSWNHPEFFCRRHRLESDVPIGDDLLFRRVSISLDVLFSAVTFNPASAQGEALGQLERAVERAGGLINLHSVTSAVGRWTRQAPAERGLGVRGRSL